MRDFSGPKITKSKPGPEFGGGILRRIPCPPWESNRTGSQDDDPRKIRTLSGFLESMSSGPRRRMDPHRRGPYHRPSMRGSSALRQMRSDAQHLVRSPAVTVSAREQCRFQLSLAGGPCGRPYKMSRPSRTPCSLRPYPPSLPRRPSPLRSRNTSRQAF